VGHQRLPAALIEAGWPNWKVDGDRMAVIFGNAIGGEKHYISSHRVRLPDVVKYLEKVPAMTSLGVDVQRRIIEETRAAFLDDQLEITEDTMPGELSNVLAGRIANLFNFHGPNYTTDAACASGFAAMTSAIAGLRAHDYDAVITGGIDRNMGIEAYVKFCKIGALSASGTRPFDADADGFVMGEGAALFVLKRLADAERDGDNIQAVILAVGGSSDGKGKGITAPNPAGQKFAVARGWDGAGMDPATCTALEAHGTSTRVGDAAELACLTEVFGASGARQGSIALGSVKSNIGHLKAGAGAAGLFKMVKQLQHKMLAPSLNFKTPNENVDWGTIPFAVNTQLRPWNAEDCPDGIRRGGVSAFGFGGTNFHVVAEEYVPGRHKPQPTIHASAAIPAAAGAVMTAGVAGTAGAAGAAPAAQPTKTPLRGALVVGGPTDADVVRQLEAVLAEAKAGRAPAPAAPDPALAGAAVRAAIDYGDAAELAGKIEKLLKAFASGNPAAFRLMRQQGMFVGRGPAPKVAFLYTGQGSQYVNMLASLRQTEQIVRDRFAQADRVMTPLLGKPLSEFIFTDPADQARVKELGKGLMQTEITQPAVLATDLALTEMLAAFGVRPDMVMGHSLGEYGALVASGALGFDQALEAVSARGREMTKVSMGDNGAMAAVFGPLDEIQATVDAADGYVVVANINSHSQAVVGGATDAVERIVEVFKAKGINATRIPVSHAFHTSIVAPASEPFVEVLRRLNMKPPKLPIVANVTGEFYPGDATTETMLQFAGQQIASPVQFVKGLKTLYDAGARVFVEVGPKKALHGFVEDVLGAKDDVLALFTNHPKQPDEVALNQALCGMYAAGIGLGTPAAPAVPAAPAAAAAPATPAAPAAASAAPVVVRPGAIRSAADVHVTPETISRLGELFAGVLAEGLGVFRADPAVAAAAPDVAAQAAGGGRGRATEPLVITGASLGLPGNQPAFDDENVARLLAGQQFITAVPGKYREMMADMRITRLVKDESGSGSFQLVDNVADVIKLAGQMAPYDVIEQFGVDKARDDALDVVTRLGIGVGFDAMRDAGIPLVMRYKTTTLGTQLPDRWLLPENLRDDTGIVFASAFAGYNRFAEAMEGYFTYRGRRENLLALEGLRTQVSDPDTVAKVDALIAETRAKMATENYEFDRRFLFRALAMGHSQFAELIGCRGPNTTVNAACASTTQALSVAEDWIRAGRCRRVIVLSADDTTHENFMPWITSGFIASGAAATDERVEDAATPFDARRHGMIIGAGAAAMVVEAADAARERGIQPIAEILGSVTANSAFHGTRLDVEHISGVMEALIREVEARGYDRHAIAPKTVFVSHETYTPARGGSAAAEIKALRDAFGPGADQIVITNTKGFTGHAMGAGIEDVLAIKSLETGIVPPVPNYKVPDPALGSLNLSKGGGYPVEFALRLAAGFGSQIALSMIRWTPMPDKARRAPNELGYAYRIINPQAWQAWLDSLSGSPGSTLEVDHRRLRIVDRGAPAVPRTWTTTVPVPYVEELGGSPSPGAAPAAAASVGSAAPIVSAAPAPAVAAPVAPAAPAVSAPVIPAAAPAPAPAAATPAAAPRDEILETVTGLVSEMTGYPPELLDPELDLEADLGVDTVKQAEVFAAVRGHWNLERDENLRLRDFPTLNHVAGWVRGKMGLPEPTAAAAAAAPAPAGLVSADISAAPAAPASGGDEILSVVTRLVAEMTGYPPELLDPELDLEADLGVDTVKQAEVFAAVRGHWNLERDENLRLRDFPTLNHVAGWVRDRLGTSAAPVAVASAVVSSPEAASPIYAPTPGTAAPAPASPAGDDVLAVVTNVVAEMTGYPVDLLDPELDLEADLGVDTVKQAEVFAAVRGHFNLERDENLRLRDFPTLNHVAGWVRDRLGVAQPTTLATPAAPAAAAAPVFDAAPPASAPVGGAVAAPVAGAPSASGAPADEILTVVTNVVAEMTGYPVDLLDPELDLEADLGVDTVKQAEVFAAVRGHFNLERDENLQLRDFPTLNHVAGWVRGKLGVAAPTAAPAGDAAVAPAPMPVDTTPAAPAGAGAAPADEILTVVTNVVAEMTGYPVELLDPELDLEADLGVDTVKQAEVFAAVRGHFNLERDENLQLRDFPTLNHVAGWVRGKLGVEAPTAAAPSAAPGDAGGAGGAAATPAGGAAAAVAKLVAGDLDAVDALPRRIPVPSLRPGLDRCAPTGVQLEGARVVVMLDEGGVGQALISRLEKAGATALTLEPGVTTDDLESTLNGWLADGGVTGVYWLAGLDREDEVADYDAEGWREATRRRVKSLYRAMRILSEARDNAGEGAIGAFLVSATHLGGYHGYDAAGATGVLAGGVTGFTKSYKKENPQSLVKAVDFAVTRRTAAVADLLVAETLGDPGCVEVGLVDGRRYGVAFVERPFGERDGDNSLGEGGMPLGPETVFVVTGAAGSIVSAITADLATASKGVFHLLDLTPKPDADDADIAAFRAGSPELKKSLAARITERGDKATPVLIERELTGIERRSAALDAIQAVEAAGGTVHYTSVDLTNDEAVAAAVGSIREISGRIDVLLHAAGIEISRPLPKKEPREYDLVFDVKTGGWHALWRAAADMEVGAVVVFSSVAGRFGNQGQTDYSAANDLMCKAVSHLRRVRPQTRGLALDWTAWGGIGMATRGSIPTIMAAAGVQMLPPEAGVAWIRRELTSSAFSGEVVVAGTLGMMAAEYDEAGGLAQSAQPEPNSAGPLVGDLRTSVHTGWTTKVELDPKTQKFLDDHRIDGIAVLPGVMGMEAFAEVAQLAAPEGYRVSSVEDVDFAAPFKFFRDEPRTLTVSAVVEPDPAGGDDLLARCSLTGERKLPGQDAPVVTTHFHGTVRLTTAKLPRSQKYGEKLEAAGNTLAADQVYTFYFHGPAYQVVEEAWRTNEGATARLTAQLPEDRTPADAPLVTAPRLVELCFQTAGLWEAGRDGRMALPWRVGRAELVADLESAAAPLVAHSVRGDDGTVSARVVDAKGRVVVRLDGYTTIAMPTSLPPEVEPALRATYGE
jgi:acyl transferase domain-containing protein